MTIERFQLLRNIGRFDSVNTGAQVRLTKLTLIYAENGRGKTTLATILRSVTSNDPQLINQRQRLGAAHPPHIVLGVTGGTVIFQNGAWSAPLPYITVFDDAFITANVCSGIEIETAHRQGLHELILGAQGVALNAALQGAVTRIEEHNRALRQKEAVIPATVRGALSLDAFCALPVAPDIDARIAEAERNLSAARSADVIRQRATFPPIALPSFDTAGINALLARVLPELEAEAGARVRAHLRNLGGGGEAWVGDGMRRIATSSAVRTHEICPFCAQELDTSPLILHYQAYFSEAYDDLKKSITSVGQGIKVTHSSEVSAAFERSVQVAAQSSEFWRSFTDVPSIDLDTATIVRTWSEARDGILTVLRTKAAAPLEAMTLPAETNALIDAYEAHRIAINNLSTELLICNARIATVKERAASANVASLTAELARQQAVQSRHSEPVAMLCENYLTEKAAKAETEKLRKRARDELDNYRQNIFPNYESAINAYLERFNAGFRLGAVRSVNARNGSSCTYNVVINNVPVSLTADTGPSFRNTLSSGDRNTLALAFFFASLDHDPGLVQKVIVIDDPMTSLDEHRSLTTVQELLRLLPRVSQVIVLSHSKPFLCSLWVNAGKSDISTLTIQRDGAGSTILNWVVEHDCFTEHDRRHDLVRAYIGAGNSTQQREVATALRPILEAFMRVAYPASFPPGQLLGPFLGVCSQRVGSAGQILSQSDIIELRALLDYANRFHHDTNSAWETTTINDQELEHFCRRTLAFAQRA